MAKFNSKRSGSISAACYYRISKDKDVSIVNQRSAVVSRFDGHGFHIVDDYVDENKAGWKRDRAAFQRLITDAQAGKFQAVLCLDQDRFSRFPPLEANHYWYLLDQAGVSIHTVAQGELKFDELADWLTASINQYGKLQYCRDISLKSTNALLEKAKRGEWPQGRPPIGYAVENDRLILGHPEEVALVVRIFTDYLAGLSLQQLVETLNAEGITTRSGNKWRRSSVRDILTRRLYTGTFVWNQRCSAEFTGVRDGQVNTDFTRGNNDESDWIVIKDNHPLVIDEATFQSVQDRLTQRSNGRGNRSPAADKYVLSGLLRCDTCGSGMTGYSSGKHEYFICSGYSDFGPSYCSRNAIREDKLLDEIIGAIEGKYMNPKVVKRLRDELHKHVKQDTGPTTMSRLKNRIDAIDQKLTKARRRLAQVDDDMVPEVQETIRELRKQRDDMQDQMDAAKLPKKRLLLDADARVDTAMKLFSRLRETLQAGDRGLLRNFLQQAVDRVVLTVDKVVRPRRCQYLLRGGDIYLQPISEGLIGTPGCATHHSRVRTARTRRRLCRALRQPRAHRGDGKASGAC